HEGQSEVAVHRLLIRVRLILMEVYEGRVDGLRPALRGRLVPSARPPHDPVIRNDRVRNIRAGKPRHVTSGAVVPLRSSPGRLCGAAPVGVTLQATVAVIRLTLSWCA